MTDVLEIETPDVQPVAEKGANLKTKLATAAVLGGMAAFGYFAEKNGWIHTDLPLPLLKHTWVGYYAAWISDKAIKKAKKISGVASGQIANGLVKTVQGLIHGDGAFYWMHSQHRYEANLDNGADFLLALGGTALFLAQNQGFSIGYTVSRLLNRFSPNFNTRQT